MHLIKSLVQKIKCFNELTSDFWRKQIRRCNLYNEKLILLENLTILLTEYFFAELETSLEN